MELKRFHVEELVKRLIEDKSWLEQGHLETEFEIAGHIKQAADAIEELQQTVEHYKGCSDDWYKEACDYKSMLPHWISVTEMLPKADEYDARGYAVPYLVMNGWMRVTARRTKDYWVLFGNGTVLEYVTHWMPLPEPPKGEENGDK